MNSFAEALVDVSRRTATDPNTLISTEAMITVPNKNVIKTDATIQAYSLLSFFDVKTESRGSFRKTNFHVAVEGPAFILKDFFEATLNASKP